MVEFFCRQLDNLSWDKVCQNIVETMGQVLKADFAVMLAQGSLENKQPCFSYQRSQSALEVIEEQILQKTVAPVKRLTVANHITEDFFLQQEHQFHSEVLLAYQAAKINSSLYIPLNCQTANISSSLCVPLNCQALFKITLVLHRCQQGKIWHPEEVQLAQIMATGASLAIAQIQAYENMGNLVQRQATLNRITNTIRSSLEPQVIFNAIVTELGESLQVDGCTLSLWTKSDRFVRCVAFYNPHETRSVPNATRDWQRSTISLVQIADNPLLQKLLAERKPVMLEDLEEEKNLARYDLPWRSKSRALLIVPLLLNGEIMGSITLRQSDTSRNWYNSEIELAQAVANQAAIAVKQARLYETTRRQAEQLKVSQKMVQELNHYLTESILKRFLPEAIANKAAAGKLVLDLSPEPHSVTILFCDLVGFTNLSSQLEVKVLSELLNEYLQAMTTAVFERGGTIDKFVGDAIMALFGAPEELSPVEQAQKAIATAQAMYHYLQPLNQKWQSQGIGVHKHLPSLQLRCGIHQGRAVVGMFGGEQRKDYTAIGKVVNIAARLQQKANPNSILVSETVFNHFQDLPYNAIEPQLLQLKGIEPDFVAYSIPILFS